MQKESLILPPAGLQGLIPAEAVGGSTRTAASTTPPRSAVAAERLPRQDFAPLPAMQLLRIPRGRCHRLRMARRPALEHVT
jgi:hypothetical protein